MGEVWDRVFDVGDGLDGGRAVSMALVLLSEIEYKWI